MEENKLKEILFATGNLTKALRFLKVLLINEDESDVVDFIVNSLKS